jgi:hypothetical protein
MKRRIYVPQNVSELLDYLVNMMHKSPTFKDRTGYLPGQNIDTAFIMLNEGLLVIRKKLGEERYATLRAMSDRMRTLFESDPDDTNGDARAGRKLILEMADILKGTAKRRAPQ